MAAKRDMLWLLVWRALRLRLQRVSVVFAALTVGATIVTALSAVWFDINTKMSEELRTFGANFISGQAWLQHAAAGTAGHFDKAPKG
jgi:putative ABC transport system permease protein